MNIYPLQDDPDAPYGPTDQKKAKSKEGAVREIQAATGNVLTINQAGFIALKAQNRDANGDHYFDLEFARELAAEAVADELYSRRPWIRRKEKNF